LTLSKSILFALALAILAVLITTEQGSAPEANAGASSTDNDGDGLPNSWETGNGPGGLNISAPPYNADPNHKDIYLEIDYMQSGDRLSCSSLQQIVDMFAQAPVANPAGGNGINIHIDADRDCGPIGDFQFGGAKQTSFALALVGNCSSESMFGTAFDSGNFARMPPAKKKVFHHALFAINISSHPQCDDLLGIARNVPGRQFIIGIEPHNIFGDDGGTPADIVREILGTTVHEFGHNLGLFHGGKVTDQNPNKPNHLSVMSYLYAGGLVEHSTGNRIMDYQPLMLPALNETSLNEQLGLNRLWAAPYRAAFFCPPPIGPHFDFGPANFNVNWNCHNGSGQLSVNANIDGSSDTFHASTPNEWARLKYNGSAFGGGVIGQPRVTGRRVQVETPHPVDPTTEFTPDDRPH
jgi:hypothetical protein